MIEAAFRRRCDEARVACTAIEDIGTPHEQIVLEAVAGDVVMPGRETHVHDVPRHAADGEGVLVAYGTGRHVARVLQTFTLLGLAGDETVELLAVAPDAAESERRLAGTGRYLAAHDVRYRLHPVVSAAAPADVILEAVHRHRPRLLVMGAPGEHPMRDLFFSSVTRGHPRSTRPRLHRRLSVVGPPLVLPPVLIDPAGRG